MIVSRNMMLVLTVFGGRSLERRGRDRLEHPFPIEVSGRLDGPSSLGSV